MSPDKISRDELIEKLNEDLASEFRSIVQYVLHMNSIKQHAMTLAERIAQAEAMGLPDVAEALTPLLSQTQDHVHDLRGALAA